MPRKTNPFKFEGGQMVGPVGSWADRIGIQEDTLKRAMSKAGVEWEGQDSYVGVWDILRSINAIGREEDAAIKRARAEDLQLKVDKGRAALGQVIPQPQLDEFMAERMQATLTTLSQLPAEAAARLSDPDAFEVLDDLLQRKVFPDLRKG